MNSRIEQTYTAVISVNDEMVIVGVFDDPTQAHLARIWLAEGGIQAHVLDQHMIGTYPLLSPALGGVRLVVAKDDSDSASEILAAKPEQLSNEQRCPECGERRITESHVGRRLAFLAVLFLGFPVGRSRPKLVCEDCGHAWRG